MIFTTSINVLKMRTRLTLASSIYFVGIVRFTSKKYTQRALERYRTSEIVVQDVAVSVRLLKADMSEIEVRRVYSNERRNR